MRVGGGGIGRAWKLFVLSVLALGLLSATASAAPPQAVEQGALRALAGTGTAADGAIVYRTTGPIPAGAVVRVAQLRGAASPLTEIGSGAMPAVLRAPSSEPAWLFYEDRAPNTLPEHDGRLVLVGAASGSAQVSAVVQGAPLVGSRWPRLLAVAPAGGGAGAPDPFPVPSPAGPTAPPTSPGRVAAASQLAAAHACFLRAADTLGGFAPYAPVRRSRAAAGRLADGLAKLAPGIVSSSYRPASRTSVAAYAQRAIDASGCGEVSLYLAGGGYRDGGEAAVAVGASVGDGRVGTQLLTGDDLRALLRSRPGVTWNVTIDAPSAGALLDEVRGEPNLASGQASGRIGDPGLVARLSGGRERSLLRFSRALLAGTRAMLADERAVATALADRDSGRAPTFLAALLTRAFEQAVGTGGFDRFGVQPQSFLRGHGSSGLAGPGSGGPGGGVIDRPQAPPNQAPKVSAGPGVLAYAENDPATALDPGLTVADADSSQLSGATVRVEAGFVAGDDVLGFASQGGIAGSWDAGTGTLALSGSASIAAYQAALRAVTYENLSDDPAAGARSVSFRVSDGRDQSAAASRGVEVSVANDAPDLQLAAAPASYTENGAATPIDATLTVSDPDSAQLAAATVKIATGLQTAEDRLELPSLPAGIAASYEEATGTLTLTGPASVAGFQAALRAVAYRNVSDNPDTWSRTVTVRAADTDGAETPLRSREITVAAANDAPSVTTTATPLAYAENDPATAVDPGLTVADVDSAQITGATVTVASGYLNGADRLGFADSGSISGSWDAGTGTLALSGNAGIAAYQAALRAVTYENLSDDPAAGARSVSFRVSDGSDQSPAASRGLEITTSNDAPDLDLPAAGALSYEEKDPATAIDPGAVLSDPDSATFAAATATIGSGLHSSEDVLELTATVPGISAGYNAATGTLTLTGPASRADFQTALRAVAYRNSSDDPDTSTRTVTLQAEDDEGAVTPARSREVTVGPVNDAPSVTTTATPLAYAENDPATAVDPGLTVADVDSPNLAGATVEVGAGYVEGEDRLAYPGGGGISASWNAAAGTLALSGSATVAAYQAALRTVSYENLSDNPPAGSRTVSFRVDDGADESAAAERTVEVSVSNDGPDVTLAGGSASYTENGAATPIDATLTVSDPDSAQLAAATVKIATGLQTVEDRLELPSPPAGIAASYEEATGTLTLTGPASLAEFQAALRAVGYRNTSEDPDTTARGVSFALTDADGATGPTRTRGLTVVAVNDTPVAVDDDGGETDEATPLTVSAPGVLANDTDLDSDPLTVVAVNGQPAKVGVAATSAKGASVTVNANGSFSYDPSGAATLRAMGEGESTTDTFTYAAGDGSASDTATVTVTVNGLPDPPEAVNDSYDGVGNTTLAVGQTGPSGQAFKQLTGSVLDNDSDPDTPHASLAVSAGTVASTLGGSATIAADGSFTYTPPTGASASTDSFDYTVSDGVQSDTGTVSVVLSGRVWYVDNSAAAGGTGRSNGAFNTLAAAATASSAGDTIYVFKGDGNSTGQNAGVTLKANQRLLGQAVDLVVGGDTLFDGGSAQRPKIGNGAGTGVTLAAGSRVEGLQIAATGGPAISGGSGVAGSTLADLVVGGNAGGVALSGTSGTFAVSSLAVTTTGGTAFLAENAGTVQFAEAGTISLAATGGRALTAGTVALSGAIDSASSSSSASGGVALASTTGSLAFGGLSIASSGSTGFLAENAAGLSIPAAATANVSNSSGPAVSVRSSNAPALAFDEASSSNSPGAGFNVDTVSGGSVTAASGTISGAAGAAVDVNAGNGTVAYGGTIANGSGRPAEVTGRTGGTVSVSGNITETDTGLLVSGNSGGTTEFSGSSKSISTGTGNAVTLSSNSGHTVNFSGGGLALTTTSGKGFAATGGGTVTVQGSNNTASSTTGTAVEVVNTTIGAADLTFRSVAANGGANGIFLNTTGSSGGLVVTGNGTAESGGVIQNTVGADGSTNGIGVYLNSTADVSLSRMRLTTNQGFAIRGSGVSGFSLLSSTVNGNNGTNDAFDEGSVTLSGLTGTSAFTDTTIEGGYEDNLDVSASSGTLNLSMTRLTVGANNKELGGNGVLLVSGGSSNVTTTVSESHFVSSREDLFQHNVQDRAVDSFTFTGNELKNPQAGKLSGGSGILLTLGGQEDADLTYRIADNTVREVDNSIFVTKGVGIGDARGRIVNNTVGVSGVAGSGSGNASAGIEVDARGQGSHTVAITGNTVRNYGQSGFRTVVGEKTVGNNGAVSFDVTASGNLATEPGPKAGAGWRTEVADPNSTPTVCLDLQGNTFSNSGPLGTDVRIFSEFPQDVFRLPGYSGGAFSESALEAYFAGRNTLTSVYVQPPTSGNGFTSTTACAQPPA